MIGNRLARHRVDHAARVQRYIYLYADASCKRIQTYEKDVVRHGFVDGPDKINTRGVTSSLVVYFLARNFD